MDARTRHRGGKVGGRVRSPPFREGGGGAGAGAATCEEEEEEEEEEGGVSSSVLEGREGGASGTL